jgi:hypothetical protein
MTAITLTDDQDKALLAFNTFIVDPIEQVFVLSGYSGTGKTTLIKKLLEEIPRYMQVAKLIDPKTKDYTVALTATTNKAAENFSQLTGQEVNTIHSFLGLRVQTNYETNVTTLVPKTKDVLEGYLVFIDEASYVDKQLLDWVFKRTKNCKIVFMGDPAQLTPVKSQGTPVFDAKFRGAHLSKIVRQAEGNPIVDLSTKFRLTVSSGEFFKFVPDGYAVQYMERNDFNAAIKAEFTRPNWQYKDSKVLAWTNKCTIGYNHAISDHLTGDPSFQVGDYAVCNKFVAAGRSYSLKTDQMVQITDISEDTEEYGVVGNNFTLDNAAVLFSPKSLAAKIALIKQARAEGKFSIVERADNQWIDLRYAFSCTINKAQGSTFDRVFIDLDDIRRCNSGDQIARMLYVGVSRAKQQVFLTGDIA